MPQPGSDIAQIQTASLIALELKNFSLALTRTRAITIRVRYFAQAREFAGVKEEQFELPVASHIQEAVSVVVGRHPRLGEMPTTRVMVNGRMIDGDVELEDGDVLVLVPPIAGG